MLKELIRRGVEVDAQTHEGRTALHMSIINDHPQTAAILIQKNCNVFSTTHSNDTGNL